MSRIFSVTTMFFLLGCAPECEQIDKRFEKVFKEQLKFIDHFESDFQETLYLEDILAATSFMQAVTGHEGELLTDNSPGYSNKQRYHQDRKAWMKWYNGNKCTFTFEQMDSALTASGFYDWHTLEIESWR